MSPEISRIELSLPRKTRAILAQLRTNKSSLLRAYLNHIDNTKYPSPLCPACNTQRHDTAISSTALCFPPTSQQETYGQTLLKSTTSWNDGIVPRATLENSWRREDRVYLGSLKQHTHTREVVVRQCSVAVHLGKPPNPRQPGKTDAKSMIIIIMDTLRGWTCLSCDIDRTGDSSLLARWSSLSALK